MTMDIDHGLFKRLPFLCSILISSGIPKVKEHQDLLVFRKPQLLPRLLRVEEIYPAAIHAEIGSGEHHMRRDYRGVLDA